MGTPLRMVLDKARGLAVPLGTLRRFRRDIYPHWPALLGALLCAVGYAAMRLAEPWPLKFVFDNVLLGRPLRTGLDPADRLLADSHLRLLAAAALAILALALLRGGCYYYQSLLTSRVGQEVVLTIRRRLFAHLQRLSLSFHARSSTGDLLTRLTGDITMLRELLVTSLLSMVSEGVILVGFLLAMVAMNWRLALLAVVVIPGVFLLVAAYSGRIREATRQQRRREGELASRLQEALAGIHVVQIFAREGDEDERLRRLNKRSLKSGLKATRMEAQLNRAVELALAAATAATLWFGATQVLAGRLTAGELIVFVSYMQGFYRPLRRISRVAERSSKAASCVERITDILDEVADVRDGKREAPPFRGEVRFEGVDFAYAPDQPVLRGVDLAIPAGRTVAVVGATGAGKTTLAGLIPRLYDPTSGVVRIDGCDAREFTLKSLRDQIAVVPQDGVLFGGTIRENIAYGKPGATDREVVAAALAANLHGFIAGLPDGYDSRIGERGVTLSGGQRQRLAIARALVKDAPIVLLDEPTTGLDAASEGQVLAALERLLAGRSALVIAHRLSTIRRADQIVMLERGRIVERGTHEELLARGGAYSALYRQYEDGAIIPDSPPRPRTARPREAGHRDHDQRPRRPGRHRFLPR